MKIIISNAHEVKDIMGLGIVAISPLHDKDINGQGEKIEPHWHAIIKSHEGDK